MAGKERIVLEEHRLSLSKEVPDQMEYTVIGGGCAAWEAVRVLLQADPAAAVTVCTDSREKPYNPMLLTYYLAGKLPEEQIFLRDAGQEFRERVRILSGSPVTALSAAERKILLNNGTVVPFEKLLIASGARASVPPVPGAGAENVFTMRTLEEARRLKNYLSGHAVRRAVVAGASMIGIKTAEALCGLGVTCCLADAADRIFPLSACPECAEMIREGLVGKGLRVRLSAMLSGIETDADGSAVRVRFRDGSEPEEADLVVLCTGVRPNIGFVNREEIRCGRGILVNARMETSVPGVYAAGDCAEGPDRMQRTERISGLLSSARAQARTAARNMAGIPDAWGGSVPHNITRFFGMLFAGIGDPDAEGETERVVRTDRHQMARIVRRDGRIVSANLLNCPELSGILLHEALRECGNAEEDCMLGFGYREFADSALKQTLRIG